MEPEHADPEGAPPRAGAAAGTAGEAAGGKDQHRDRWRRLLLLVWGGVMTAVVLTGIVGFLVYFYLLVR